MVTQIARPELIKTFNSAGYNSFNPTVTASEINQKFTQPSVPSVSCGIYTDNLAPTLDSQGLAAAGDVVGETFIAKDDNINGVSVFGKHSNIAGISLITSLAYPASYSAAGVPTFSMAAGTIQTLDDDGTYGGTPATTLTTAASAFNKNDKTQVLTVPFHYCVNGRAFTTVSTATAIGDTSIVLASVTNAVDNHNDLPSSNSAIKGEKMVIRKTNGKEYSFMIASVNVGTTTITIVPGMYDAGMSIGGGGFPVVFAVGDQVYFPLTPGNTYMVYAYGSAAGSTITLYGNNTANTKYVGGSLYTSTTGWTNLAVSAGKNLFFIIHSTPSTWQLDSVTIREYSSTAHLDSMAWAIYKRAYAQTDMTVLKAYNVIPASTSSMSIGFDTDLPSNSENIFQVGDVLWLEILANAQTTAVFDVGFRYNRNKQENFLWKDITPTV